VLTPQGKVSRYFYGILYPARDIRLALVEAASEKIGNPVDAVLLYCCEYDPVAGKYNMIVAHVLKISGAITLLCMGTLIFALSRGGRQKAIQDSKFKIQDAIHNSEFRIPDLQWLDGQMIQWLGGQKTRWLDGQMIQWLDGQMIRLFLHRQSR
jgi:predicted membrane metal-binding protein